MCWACATSRRDRERLHEVAERVQALEAEKEAWLRERVELRAEAHKCRRQAVRAGERAERFKAENTRLRAEVRSLKQRLFGRKHEQGKGVAGQGKGGAGQGKKAEGQRERGQQPGNGAPGRREYPDMEQKPEIHDLPEGERVCPCCGLPFESFIRDEESYVYEVHVRAYTRRIVKKCYRPTCRCGGVPQVVMPAVIGAVFPGSNAGVSLVVEALLAKYRYGEPFHRLLQRWGDLGFPFPAGTLHGLMNPVQRVMAPLAGGVRAHNRQAQHWHIDESRWIVLAKIPGKDSHHWWIWVFVTEDSVVFIVSPHRSADVVREHLGQDPHGIASVDRYSAYKAVALRALLFLLAFCWVHVRRDFLALAKAWPNCEPWATGWVDRIATLYHVNNQRRALLERPRTAAYRDADLAVRTQVGQFHQEWRRQLADPTLHPAARKVLTSVQEHWQGLTLFVDHPWLPMDNNTAERAIRPQVIGRNNYFFSGAVWTSALHADLATIFFTLERNGINLQTWLTDYLTACAINAGKAPPDYQRFLPWNASPADRKRWSHPLPPPPHAPASFHDSG